MKSLCTRTSRAVTLLLLVSFRDLWPDQSHLTHQDASKIIRSAYGTQKDYTKLSSEALSMWNQWNEDVKTVGSDNGLGLTPSDKIWTNNGVLMCSDRKELTDFEKSSATAANVEGEAKAILMSGDSQDEAVAASRGIQDNLQPFAKKIVGILDTTGGVISADKACLLALYKAKQLGVRFVFGEEEGSFASLVFEHDNGSKVDGIKTRDGKIHNAKTVIMACGGWTPSLLPEMDGLCETTAGSVALFKIPPESPLREKFSAQNFPAWMFKQREGVDGGLFGFPVDQNGMIKIGYRGTKYTNPATQPDGKSRSVPRTRWTADPITNIPAKAMEVISRFVAEYLPGLGDENIDVWMTRLCWYTDSYDNHYVIDRVPGRPGLMCATGGSGHAFKYLPNIGKWVVDILEQKEMERPLIKAWRWRSIGKDESPANILLVGEDNPHTLANTSMLSIGI